MNDRVNYITLSDPSCEPQPRHLAYYEFGDRANPDIVICAHGLSRNGLDFEPLADSLSKKYRVICPDIAGRGNSSWLSNKSDYNYITYLSDMQRMLSALSISSASWVGTSMGGIIGMMLAASQPGIIKKLVLNDIGKIVSAAGLKRILGYVGTSGIFASREEALDYLKTILTPFGITSETQWEFMFNTSLKPLSGGRYALRYDPDISKPFRESASKENAVSDIDLSSFWNTINCPVLILRGALSDILTSHTAAQMCAEKPDVKLVELAGIGHAPALLDPFQILTVTDWLDIVRTD